MSGETVVQEAFTGSETMDTDGLIGAFEFNHRLDRAYGVIRFLKSPGMQELDSGFTESTGEHMWRSALLWDNVLELLPNLAQAVNTKHVHDLILVHDIGEIIDGDVSRFTKVSEGDHGKFDKYESEAAAVAELTEGLEGFQQDWYVDAFREFENPVQEERSKESLVANLIESIHGDFTFFDNCDMETRQIGDEVVTTDEFLNGTRRVVGKYTRPHFVRLIELFEDEGKVTAADDLRKLASAFCRYVAVHPNPHVPELGFTVDFLATNPEA